MVRAQGKQSAEDRKEGKKKSSGGGAKKKPETGSWPCKIDGCKKVFAREADLKRHQRTTKTHSIPGFQCPQCDATFTRTDALRRHQKSRHNGVVIEPSEEKGKHSGDGASSGSRSPSPGGSPSRSHGEGSMNGSPPATQTSNAGSSSGPSSYYRPHTMQDGGGYYAGYPPPPRPPPAGMMMDPHYPPPPIGLPTSATRSHQASWQTPPQAPPWAPDGHAMPPPPGMYMPSYYPSPYYRHPGMPLAPHPSHFPPQINPDLLSQSNGQMGGVAPPESALRDTSPDKPEGAQQDAGDDAHSVDMSASPTSVDPRNGDSLRTTQVQQQSQTAGVPSQSGPDASTLIAAAALEAVLAYQKEQEIREAAAATTRREPSAPDGATQVPATEPPPATTATGIAPVVDPSIVAADSAIVGPGETIVAPGAVNPAAVENAGQPNTNEGASATVGGDDPVAAQPSETVVEVKQADADAPPQPMEQLLTEDGMPMLNPAELLTQVWAVPPAS
ncbi:hypothetical protein C8Q77DRAFT_120374 [Trametes polyzona]|nr:hypothetical protein C8Q77DRAFT_120374 [Trametes polyzona]